MQRRPVVSALVALLTQAPDAALAVPAVPIWVGRFTPVATNTSSAAPLPWRVVQLNAKVPPTQFQIRTWDGVTAIEANARASMALLARPLELDLSATPVLCWRWRVERVLQLADLTTKNGDDYAARVYVAFHIDPSALSLSTRASLGVARAIYGPMVPDGALNYVWDNHHAVGTRAPNAYTSRTLMVVQRSGATQLGQWVGERVNVLADATQAFGTDKLQATLLAVAADTDNTGEQAHSGFADLHFVGANQACRFEPAGATP